MREERGFTLLEVLAAGAVAAVATLAVATMYITAYGTTGRSGRETIAVHLAQQRFEWLKSQDYSSTALSAGTSTEALAGAYVGYTRTTVIEDDAPMTGVKRVTVTTLGPRGRDVQLVSLISQ